MLVCLNCKENPKEANQVQFESISRGLPQSQLKKRL
jgi:hypothetical protein